MPQYIVISPVKDEQQHLETTLRSMIDQTLRPLRWIIVDDGSGDQTAEIAERYAGEHSWISLVRLPRRTSRQPGSPVIRAFNAGFELIRDDAFDFIVKLDCDLRLTSRYFEELLSRFEADPQLGIASGVYREERGDHWEPVLMPEYHAAGACKVIRAACFRQIGGFVVARGWDTVDEIRAQTLGWRTRHFAELTFDHLRPEGSSRGSLYTSRLHGEVYYLTGGSALFFLLKAAHRMLFGRPPLISGLMLVAGYLKPMLLRRERLVSSAEARHYRSSLNVRLRTSIGNVGTRLGVSHNRGGQS